MTSAATIAGLLADPDRLRVLSAVALGAGGEEAIAERAGLDLGATRAALGRLAGAGLLAVGPDAGWSVQTTLFAEAARRAAEERRARQTTPEELGATPEQARVLRNFMVDGALTSIPTARSKRLLLLDFLSSRFDPGVTYTEAQVNETLGRYHPDVAALRRYLVDEEFLERRDGFYWRAGGTFEVT